MDSKALQGLLGDKAVIADPQELAKYRVDGITPQLVVMPENAEQAAEVIKMANRDKFSVVPLGGGTHAATGGRLKSADVVLSTRRLDKTIDMDTANLTVTAQAGVRFGDLQDLLAGLENRCYFPIDSDLKETAEYMCSGRDYKGAFIPLDPPAPFDATMGGIVAANTTGPRRLGYRLVRDLLLGVRFVSPTGEIIGTGGKTVKNVSGYDVSKLIIGSQGCLGLVLEMTLRLWPMPENTGALLAAFEDLDTAKDFCDAVLGSKLLPMALELMDATALGLSPVKELELPDGGFAVAVDLAGFDEEVAREFKDLKEMAAKAGAAAVVEFDAMRARAFWMVLGENSITQTSARFKASYPLSCYGEFMAAVAGLGLGGKLGASISTGNGVAQLYLLDEVEPQEAARAGEALRNKALELKGSMVLEHGSPELKELWDPWGPMPHDLGLLKSVKNQLDPAGVMNPGRFPGGL